MLTSDTPNEFPRSGWFPAQRGIGAHVQCEPCNEGFGARYVRAYAAFADLVGQGAIRQIQAAGFIPGHVDVDVQGWEIGDIARAGLVQLMSLGVHDRLIRRYPALSEIVLKGTGTRYRPSCT